MGDMEFLSTTEFIIPVGQMVSYMFFSTLCFFFRKYKLGLLISFAYVFNWGFLYGTANFIGMMGNPTPGIIVYLLSGLMLVTIALVGFFRKE